MNFFLVINMHKCMLLLHSWSILLFSYLLKTVFWCFQRVSNVNICQKWYKEIKGNARDSFGENNETRDFASHITLPFGKIDLRTKEQQQQQQKLVFRSITTEPVCPLNELQVDLPWGKVGTDIQFSESLREAIFAIRTFWSLISQSRSESGCDLRMSRKSVD